MNKIILFILLLTMSATLFSQQTNTLPALTKQDYLRKSKNQKTAAWILVAGGAAMIVTGGVVWSNEINKKAETDPFGAWADMYTTTSGDWIAVAGVVAAAGSIPLFIAASKNKRKAMSLSFKKETVPSRLLSGQKGSFVNQSIPSLSLKINL
ncbi:MAG TPA: hypothetical protein VK483_13010 [Chitinophagaceae bacterium]|nr:hypothetical protein [Chitinophagaceae bacterium]